MHHSFTLAASLLTLLPTVFAAGTAHVVNNCGIDVWYASVAQNVGAPMQLLPSGGYSETYNKANVGISIKLAATEGGDVTQFEFTWDSPNINYDISNINGNPFAQQGMSLVPSMVGASGYPTCVAVNCPAGQATCDAAYNMPDDVRTKVCPEDSDLTFTLCPGGPVAQPSSSSAASSSAKPTKSVPASTQASVPVSTPSSVPTSTAPSAPSAPATSKSVATSAVPTSFKTLTTQAAAAPSAPSSSAVASSPMQAPAPAASSVAQSPSADAPTAPAATTPAAQSPAATQAWTWSRGGGWGHYHTRRAHIHRFDS